MPGFIDRLKEKRRKKRKIADEASDMSYSGKTVPVAPVSESKSLIPKTKNVSVGKFSRKMNTPTQSFYKKPNKNTSTLTKETMIVNIPMTKMSKKYRKHKKIRRGK